MKVFFLLLYLNARTRTNLSWSNDKTLLAKSQKMLPVSQVSLAPYDPFLMTYAPYSDWYLPLIGNLVQLNESPNYMLVQAREKQWKPEA